MVTSDEIAAIPLFASLSEADRERLALACADVALAEGEFAVHEDEERALFAVLAGRIEVVKAVDGIPRVLGQRLPGEIFGEVPITLGTTFPSGFRAAEQSRVMQVAVGAILPVAAAAPEVALQVGALARERIGGLQGVAAEPPAARAVVLGHRWDAACSDLRRFLDRNQMTFDWVVPEVTMPASAGAASCRPRRLPRAAHDDGTTSCGRSCARSPSCSGSRPARPPPSTTRSSSAPGRRVWPPRCTARRRG